MNPRVRRLIVSGVLVALVVIVLVAAMAQAARAEAAGQTPAATAAPAAPASPSAPAGTEEEAPAATVNRSGTFLALGLALLLALVAAAVIYGRDRNPGEPASPGARRRIESPDSPDTTRPNPIVSAGGDRLSDGDPGQ